MCSLRVIVLRGYWLTIALQPSHQIQNAKLKKNLQRNECTMYICVCPGWLIINTLRPRENGRHFADDIFKCIFVNENLRIPITISLKFVPKGPINNIPALVQTMAWRRPGDKPLSEPMMVRLPTHICVTRPQWVNGVLCHLKSYTYTCICIYEYDKL